MEKEFIPYEQALALKELGFDEPCLTYYEEDKYLKQVFILQYNKFELFSYRNLMFENENTKDISAPTFSQAFRWFREKYNLDVTFRKMDYGPESQFTGYYFSVYRGNELIDIHGADKKGKLYEDSELECLKKLIQITNEKV